MDGKARTCPTSSQSQARYQGPRSSTVQARTARRIRRGSCRTVEKAGGCVVGQYKEPLGGHPTLLSILPIDKIEPTPFQRDLSDTHHKRLADVINKTGYFLDPLIAVLAPRSGFWTPNGRHRLEAMRRLGAKSITALVIPEREVAWQILALNTDGGQLGKEQIELLVRDILDSAIAGIAQKNAPITLRVDDETLSVMGNERELVRLFANVLENAAHTPSGGAIHISAEAEGEYVLINVSDTGPGIAPEHLLHLGERFYRVDTARSRPDGGTGLGLSIGKGIIEAHHRGSNIESTLGVGTTVRIRLPRVQ